MANDAEEAVFIAAMSLDRSVAFNHEIWTSLFNALVDPGVHEGACVYISGCVHR